MSRTPDRRGRDRTRTIQLRGDVADIAQQLANENKLSKVISDLLYEKYGYKNKQAKLIAKAAALDAQIDKMMLERTNLENRLEMAKNKAKQEAHLKEEIELKLESMIDALRTTQAMIQCGTTHNQYGQSYKKIQQTQSELVEKYRKQLEAFE